MTCVEFWVIWEGLAGYEKDREVAVCDPRSSSPAWPAGENTDAYPITRGSDHDDDSSAHRRLDGLPKVAPPPAWRLRHYAGPSDIGAWLALREAAFADSPKPVRPWTRDDFQREITSKTWWRPDALWLVEAVDRDVPLAIGTAVLARRGAAETGMPVIHWLAVWPEYRGLASAGC